MCLTCFTFLCGLFWAACLTHIWLHALNGLCVTWCLMYSSTLGVLGIRSDSGITISGSESSLPSSCSLSSSCSVIFSPLFEPLGLLLLFHSSLKLVSPLSSPSLIRPRSYGHIMGLIGSWWHWSPSFPAVENPDYFHRYRTHVPVLPRHPYSKHHCVDVMAVSYTHLTLPTKRIV